MLVFPSLRVFADGSDWIRLTQYRHRVWRGSEGWFDGRIHAIAQGADGYIWIATDSGLLRFDGIRFSEWPMPFGRKPFTRVVALLESREGTLWMVSDQGLSFYDGEKLTDVPLAGGAIQSLSQDRSGNIWAARAVLKPGQFPLCMVSVRPVKCYGPNEGLTTRYATSLVQDPDGYYWIGGGRLVRWKPGTPQVDYFAEALKSFGNNQAVAALLALSDGSVLAGLAVTGPTAGLQQWRNGQWQALKSGGFDGGDAGGEVLFQDREGSIWLSPSGPGLVHLQNGHSDTYQRSDGLSGDGVMNIIQDTERSVWVATEHGLDQFSEMPVISYAAAEGMPLGRAAAVVAQPDGSVLVAYHQQAVLLKDGVISPAPGFERIKHEGGVASALIDSAQNLWMGQGNQLFLYKNGTLQVVKTASGADSMGFGETVDSLTEDANHQVWGLISGSHHKRRLVMIASQAMQEVIELPSEDLAHIAAADRTGGLWTGGNTERIGYFKNGKLTTQSLTDAAPGFNARDMFVDFDDRLWVVSNQGLRIMTAGKSLSVKNENGLPCVELYSALIDRDETLWINGACGLMQIKRQEWSKLFASAPARMDVRLLGAAEGWTLGSAENGSKFKQASDGKLWFEGRDLQMLDPSALERKNSDPPIHIEMVTADNHPYRLEAPIRIPPNPREVRIDYSALSFINPRKIEFRYKLEGHDDAWQTPGSRRQAFYTDLAPGHYQFRVVVGGQEPTSTQHSDRIEFTILPAFYQTWWFRTLCLLAASLMLWALYIARLTRVTGMLRLRHQERLLERESIARDLHDTFFQSVQSLFLRIHTAAKQLPEKEAARDTLEGVLDDSDRVMLQGRQVMLELRAESSKTMTLAEALAALGADLQTAYPCEFRVTVIGDPLPLLPLVFEEMRRFGQEALSNAFRHAHAKLIEAEIHYTRSEFKVRIRDDGIGIDAAVLEPGFRPGHWGLPGMRERAAKIGGRLELWSRAGAGTEIELHLSGGAAYAAAASERFRMWTAAKQ